MLTVWKYQINLGEFDIEMPRGAELLSAQMQGQHPMLWVRVESEAPKAWRRIVVCGTGHSAPIPAYPFVATFQAGWTVWHVFDGGERDAPITALHVK